MGVSVVAIGGLLGVFIAATLTQWYYTKRIGAEGLPCLRTDRPTSSLDLGWGAAQIHEITEELHDLTSRARTLERELAEVRLTRDAMAAARRLGEEGQHKFNELKTMQVVRRGLSKRIVGGLGHAIHGAGTRLKAPFRTLLHGRPSHEHQPEGGEAQPLHEQELEHEETEEEIELRLREDEIQAELADIDVEKGTLEQIKISEAR